MYVPSMATDFGVTYLPLKALMVVHRGKKEKLKTMNMQLKIKIKEYTNNTKENHQVTREEKKKGTEKKYKNNHKTINKVTRRAYLSISL